jgi:hypothetical protein
MSKVPSGCGKARLALAFSVAPEDREVNEIGPALKALATNDDRKDDRPFHERFHA